VTTHLSVGAAFTSSAVTVTESHVVAFAGLTGDWMPHHVDDDFARRSGFGGRIAHGPLTLALALGLGTQLNVFEHRVVAWLGLDDVRALAPVRFGDTIRTYVEVIGLRETSDTDRLVGRLRYRVVNEDHAEVMTFVNKLLLSRDERR
jgi:acyl dehydratase